MSRQELEELRRLDELEQKSSGVTKVMTNEIPQKPRLTPAQEMQNTLLGAPAAAIQGASFGWAPKIAAGIGAPIAKGVLEGAELLNPVTGNNYQAPALSDLYKRGVQKNESLVKNFREYHPYQSLAMEILGGVGTGGGFNKAMQATKLAKTLEAAKAAKYGLGTAAKLGINAAGGEAAYRAYKTGEAAPGQELNELTSGAPIGAAFGVAAPMVAGALGKTISPNVRENVKKLIQENIPVTPGQILGGGWQKAEDALTSIPLLGDVINSAKGRTLTGFRRTRLEKPLKIIGEKLPKDLDGNEAVDYVNSKLNEKYQELLPNLTAKPDKAFFDEIDNLHQMVANDYRMGDAEKQKFTDILNNIVKNRVSGTPPGPVGGVPVGHNFGGPQANISGTAIKDIQNQLFEISSSFKKSADLSERQLGYALDEMQGTLRTMLQRSNPKESALLESYNKAWAHFKRVQNASAKLGAKEGNFSPNQYRNAVRAMDRSKDKSKFARGDALDQEMADAAASVLPSTVPDSGTPRRLVTGLVGAGGLGTVSPKALIGGAALSSLYTKPGMKAMEYALARRPESAPAVRKLVESLGRPELAGAIGNRIASPTLQNPTEQDAFTPEKLQELQGTLGQIQNLFPQEQTHPILEKIGNAESGGNDEAKNPNSTASGRFQFTDPTWKYMVGKYGKETGIKLKDKNKPEAQKTMASLYLRDNSASLEKSLGRSPNDGELYMAHFLGPEGAKRLIKNLGKDVPVTYLFPPQYIRANKNIFMKGTRPRTVDEVYQILASKVA